MTDIRCLAFSTPVRSQPCKLLDAEKRVVGAMQELLGHPSNVHHRLELFTHANVRCLFFNLDGLGFHDGSSIEECGHGGVVDSPGGMRSYHGTRRLHAVLATKVLLPADERPLTRCDGFYHSARFGIAAKYGRPCEVGGVSIRPVFVIQAFCANSCHNKRPWVYTRRGCHRYKILGVPLLPTAGLNIDVL